MIHHTFFFDSQAVFFIGNFSGIFRKLSGNFQTIQGLFWELSENFQAIQGLFWELSGNFKKISGNIVLRFGKHPLGISVLYRQVKYFLAPYFENTEKFSIVCIFSSPDLCFQILALLKFCKILAP